MKSFYNYKRSPVIGALTSLSVVRQSNHGGALKFLFLSVPITEQSVTEASNNTHYRNSRKTKQKISRYPLFLLLYDVGMSRSNITRTYEYFFLFMLILWCIERAIPNDDTFFIGVMKTYHGIVTWGHISTYRRMSCRFISDRSMEKYRFPTLCVRDPRGRTYRNLNLDSHLRCSLTGNMAECSCQHGRRNTSFMGNWTLLG